MSLRKYRTLKASFGFSIVIKILTVIAFIIAISLEGYSIRPSPIISTDSATDVGNNMTVLGQNFTPGGTAVLYGTGDNYTGNVDKNGNTSWSFRQMQLIPYAIYAVDGTTNNKSNTLTISPVLNDHPPSPYPVAPLTPKPTPATPMDIAFVILIATGAIQLLLKWSKDD